MILSTRLNHIQNQTLIVIVLSTQNFPEALNCKRPRVLPLREMPMSTSIWYHSIFGGIWILEGAVGGIWIVKGAVRGGGGGGGRCYLGEVIKHSATVK